MKRAIITLALLSTPTLSYADCWIVSGLHGKSAFSGDEYDFIDDSVTGVKFKVAINGNKASITNMADTAISEVSYVPLSNNTIVGSYQAGGGITVETWSITSDKKVIYSKVMNIPGLQDLTSTKAFVGDVVGNCDK